MEDKRPVTMDAAPHPTKHHHTYHVRGKPEKEGEQGKVLIQATLTKREAEALANICGNANSERVGKEIVRRILKALESDTDGAAHDVIGDGLIDLAERWLDPRRPPKKAKTDSVLSFAFGEGKE